MPLPRIGIKLFIPAFLIAGLTVGACSSSGSNDEVETEPIWNYAPGPAGPASWGSLAPEFATCGTGQAQSPIDITVDVEDDVPQFGFDYREDGLDLENDGHKLILHTDAGSDIMLNGVDFDLTSIHFHVPSEHLLKGEEFLGEVHLVHESNDGTIAIVAVWLKDGPLNKALSLILSAENVPLLAGERLTDAEIRIDPEDLLPEDRRYYAYTGSLSEPPCTEGVQWIVLREPVDAGSGQIAFLLNLFDENARPVQALNGRSITQSL